MYTQKTVFSIPWKEITTEEVHSEEASNDMIFPTWDLSLCDSCTLSDCYQKNKDCKENKAGRVFKNGNFGKKI